ncbi:RNA polymerase sigma factor SigZ [Paracrocinitomix mangrovi]|uniref:RNA polymerase sigma factor SigZ n=1 Tax=Paracrocinitomix mangrovi TaxID=2862509 RepID=UPI001C8E36EC|nr:RNA polymerase sigma factor SigZ [Paracrocinitomix mangrovi]UKN03629.1 RNA polymerase sigma factor SigZ [Paracrocinitomix mangrovi]
MSTELIWKDFSDRLQLFILSKVNNLDIANDLLQDVFVKIHQNQDQLKDGTKLESWLFQICRNAIIDYYRKKKISTDVDVEQLKLVEEVEDKSDVETLSNCLLPLINSLPDKYADALKQTHYKNIQQKDLAIAEGISYSAYKSRVQRARQMIKDQMVACCNPTVDVYGNVIEKEACKSACGCED